MLVDVFLSGKDKQSSSFLFHCSVLSRYLLFGLCSGWNQRTVQKFRNGIFFSHFIYHSTIHASTYVQQMKLLRKKEGYCSALALQEPQEEMQL